MNTPVKISEGNYSPYTDLDQLLQFEVLKSTNQGFVNSPPLNKRFSKIFPADAFKNSGVPSSA